MSPLTIVHVGCFPTGLHPYPDHSVHIKLTNGMIRLGHLVLSFSDRDIARSRSFFGSRKFGGRHAVNRALISFCNRHRPDVILLGHADMINAQTLLAIRHHNPKIRIGQWNVDPLMETDNVRRIRSKVDVVDVTFISTAGALLEKMRDGRYAMSFMPNPTDSSIENGRVDLQSMPEFDLFYACGNPAEPLRNICGSLWNMNDFIHRIVEELPTLRTKLAGINGTPHLENAAYRAAVQSSSIGLNISRFSNDFLYSSDRIAQLAGNGCVVAIERSVGYDRFFGEDEMLFFSSIDELVEKIARLSRDPKERMKMGSAGRRRYCDIFNEKSVAAHILDVLMESSSPEDMPWGNA